MRYGVIAIDERLFTERLPATLSPRVLPFTTRTASKLKAHERELLDAIKAAFLLPPEYTIIGVQYEFYRRVYLVGVTSELLPETPVGTMPPLLTPVYTWRLVEQADGSEPRRIVSIERIEVYVPPTRDQWPVIVERAMQHALVTVQPTEPQSRRAAHR